MVYRSHVGGLLVGSSRLWRAMTHRGMLGRAARSLRFHVHARHAVMIHLLRRRFRSEEHTSELQSLMRISYAVFCLKKKKTNNLRSKTRKQHTTDSYYHTA